MKEKLKFWILNTDISNLNKKHIYLEFNTFSSLYNEVFLGGKSSLDFRIIKKLKDAYFNIEENNLLNYAMELKIKVVIFDEEAYPGILREYEDYPFGMFYRGDISIINNNKNLSVVGSRRCTRYGGDATEYILKQLKEYNINIVSGMAKGIDGIAHSCALKNSMKTVAILGSGIDIVYPKENIKIYNEIIENGGCVLSEYPLGTAPISYNFPRRNRIISGIGDVLLVVEGSEKSGTLITVGTALKQGKPVVAVPGSIFSLESKGTNQLIYDGATPYTHINDILDLLHISACTINNNKEEGGEESVKNILSCIIDDNPIHIDNIIKLTHIDIKQLYKLLFELQANKEILCLSGNFYVKVNHSKKA